MADFDITKGLMQPENTLEFRKWPKIARMNRDMIITEKIDGTNAQLLIIDIGELSDGQLAEVEYQPRDCWCLTPKGLILTDDYMILAGSRKRWLLEGKDNFGFWKWANDNAEELLELGPGRHYGEWWGAGIQRKYELADKRFSLFNIHLWNPSNIPSCCHVVPILYEGPFSTVRAQQVCNELEVQGSRAAEGFMKPEGVVVYHKHGNYLFKITCENDEVPKGLVK